MRAAKRSPDGSGCPPGAWGHNRANGTAFARPAARGQDIRPSWASEQVIHLLPNTGGVLLPESPHDLWLTHADQLGAIMRGFLPSVIPVDDL